jgi:hypothetical protein
MKLLEEAGAAAGREALGELAPRRDDLLAATAALGLALAATVRVVDRVAGDAARDRAAAHPALAAGLAERAVDLVAVADDADRGPAAGVDQAELAGGHLEGGVAILDADQLEAHAGRAGQLGALARDHLHAVELGRGRDDGEGVAVADREPVQVRRHRERMTSPTFRPSGAGM